MAPLLVLVLLPRPQLLFGFGDALLLPVDETDNLAVKIMSPNVSPGSLLNHKMGMPLTNSFFCFQVV